MIWTLLLIQAASVPLLVLLLARIRRCRFVDCVPELGIGWVLPGVGVLSLAVQIVAETARQTRPGDSRSEATSSRYRGGTLREELGVQPFLDLLHGGERSRVENAMKRLARSESRHAFGRLREALRHPDREVQLLARSLLLKIEDRMVRRIRETDDPVEQGYACWTLSTVDPDYLTRRQYLRRAAEAFRRAHEAGRDGTLLRDLGDVLLEEGNLVGAQETFRDYLDVHPDDPEGHARLAEVAFRLRKYGEVRRICAGLAARGDVYERLAEPWLRRFTSD